MKKIASRNREIEEARRVAVEKESSKMMALKQEKIHPIYVGLADSKKIEPVVNNVIATSSSSALVKRKLLLKEIAEKAVPVAESFSVYVKTLNQNKDTTPTMVLPSSSSSSSASSLSDEEIAKRKSLAASLAKDVMTRTFKR